MAEKIIIELDLEKGDVTGATKALETSATKSGKKSASNFSKAFNADIGDRISSSLANITSNALKASAALGSVTLFKAIKDASQLEVINTQFEVMLKSASAAQNQVRELQDFAASTPFQLAGLAEATKQLLSFGVAQDKIIPTLSQLGDISAGVGAEITDLTIPFGRLISTQKLTLQELDKFADRGVNIYKELADQTGRSLKTIREDISKGTVPFEEFTKALSNLTGESGLFFQGMEKQSKTLSGTISTLGDNFFNLSANLGKAFSPVVMSGVKALTGTLKEFNKEFVQNFNAFEDLLIPLTNFSDQIITFVISPLELVKNIVTLAQNSINFFVSGFVAGIGDIASAAGKLISLLSPDSETAQALISFGETSKSVFNEVATDLGNSLTGVLDFPISEKLAAKNESLRASLVSTNAIILEEATSAQENLNTALVTQSETLNDSLSKATQVTADKLKQTQKQVNQIVNQGITRAISGGIQNIANSLAEGENVFENFGNFVLTTFGDLAIQLGQFYIAQGIANLALKNVDPTGTIAAGAGLVALGSIIKSFGSSGGSSSSGVAASGTTSAPGELTTELASPDAEVVAEERTNVTLNIEGSLVRESEATGWLSDLLETSGSRDSNVIPSLRTGTA